MSLENSETRTVEDNRISQFLQLLSTFILDNDTVSSVEMTDVIRHWAELVDADWETFETCPSTFASTAWGSRSNFAALQVVRHIGGGGLENFSKSRLGLATAFLCS